MGFFADVQRVVRRIPRGKVSTYGEVARASGRPGAARQVAWALKGASERGIPWQRVLGQGGRILLPGAAGLHQRTLLEIEGVKFKGDKVDMRESGYVFRKR
jgi:methylated-DNA-protein-cysteine methyltransferase-like protein